METIQTFLAALGVLAFFVILSWTFTIGCIAMGGSPSVCGL